MSKRINAAALSLSIAAGGLAGGILGVPALAGAQESEAPATTQAEAAPDAGSDPAATPDEERGESRFGRRDGGFKGERGDRLESLAELLGTDVDSLRAQIGEGADPKELLSDAGITREQIQAHRAADVEERLTEAVASGELTEAEAEEFRTRQAERQANKTERRAERTETLADVLGTNAADLEAQREAGASFAEIVEAAGGEPDAVKAELQARRQAAKVEALAENAEALAERVEAGELTQEEADQIAERMESGERGSRGGRGGHHRGNGPDRSAAEAPTDA